MTTAAFMIVAVCAVLYLAPQLRTVKGLHALRIILASAAILFGIALMYSNFMGVSILAPRIGDTVRVVYSMSVTFTAIIVLGVAGIMILVAGIMSIVVSSKALAAQAQAYPRPQTYPAPEVPPPPVYAAPTQRTCPVCGAQNAVAAAYCSNCGTKL